MSVMGTEEAAGYIAELLDSQLSTLDLIRGEWAAAIKRSYAELFFLLNRGLLDCRTFEHQITRDSGKRVMTGIAGVVVDRDRVSEYRGSSMVGANSPCLGDYVQRP